MIHVADIRSAFVKQKAERKDDEMLELLNVCFKADEDIIFGEENEAYVGKELAWYDSQHLSIATMPDPPKIWQKVSGVSGQVNSNYGWMVYSPENQEQFWKCRDELLSNSESRRAVMIYMRPSMYTDATAHGKNDFVCTWGTQFFIRDNVLTQTVSMRSNDAVFGYKNDVRWHQLIHERLWRSLRQKYSRLVPGPITWMVGSLHVYPRHHRMVL